MSHLGERIADYLVGEMTDSEKAEASEHIRQCTDCASQVESFKRTLAMLQSVPDREPPRPLVFEVEQKSQPASWLWRWASPAMAAVAASILTVMLMTPSSGTEQSWQAELQRRDQTHSEDLLRLRTELALLEKQQLLAKGEAWVTARDIQLLAKKLPTGD
jgi:anti-sigma factor RsiW